jgi:hypothetical protein
MRWALARFLCSSHGRFGVLSTGTAGLALFTCEDDALAIPASTYTLRRRKWFTGDLDTWEITVPGRSAILLHPGNTEEHTTGCVLPGMKLGVLRVVKDQDTGRPARKLAVLESKRAHALFMQATRDQETMELVVTDSDA